MKKLTLKQGLRLLRKREKSESRRAIIKKLDKVVSDIAKKRDRYTCVRCQKRYPEGSRALHASHFFSRRYMGTRFDLDNIDTLCYGCHRLAESDKQGWYKDFKMDQLMEDYITLETRAYAVTKFSTSDLRLLLLKLNDNPNL